MIELNDYSPDGRWILYQQYDVKTRWDLWALPLEGTRTPVPFRRTPFDEHGATFSRDGKWIAYQSDESGRNEVFVESFSDGQPGNRGRWQISSGGGTDPQWARDGKEIYYLSANRMLMAVRVKAPGSFDAAPRSLFRLLASSAGNLNLGRYSPTTAGDFVAVVDKRDESSPPPTVVLNWQAGLSRTGP